MIKLRFKPIGCDKLYINTTSNKEIKQLHKTTSEHIELLKIYLNLN